MECKTARRNISCWVDGELKATKKSDFEGHLRNCLSCQKEAEAFQALNSILTQATDFIEPSRHFDAAFWDKVTARQKTPWFVRLLNDLEVLIPALNLKQAAVFATLAFFIGNLGGVASTMRAGLSGGASVTAIGQFSALQEFKGIPSYSLAATYLKTVEKGVSE